MSSQMLVDPGEVVVLLPAATRYEQRDGGTETTTERRIAFSPEIPGPRPGEVRSEWEIFVDLAPPRRARRAPTCARSRPARRSATRSRASCPCTRGSSRCAPPATRSSGAAPGSATGGTFPTPDGKAHFLAGRAVGSATCRAGSFVLSTRRGKQFNTMVHQEQDPLTGAMRDALFMATPTSTRSACATVTVSSCAPTTARCAPGVHVSPLRPGNVQVFFPEGNVLLRAGRRDPASGVPDYNAVVTVEAGDPR